MDGVLQVALYWSHSLQFRPVANAHSWPTLNNRMLLPRCMQINKNASSVQRKAHPQSEDNGKCNLKEMDAICSTQFEKEKLGGEWKNIKVQNNKRKTWGEKDHLKI